MNVEIGTEAAQFLFSEYVNGAFVAVWFTAVKLIRIFSLCYAAGRFLPDFSCRGDKLYWGYDLKGVTLLRGIVVISSYSTHEKVRMGNWKEETKWITGKVRLCTGHSSVRIHASDTPVTTTAPFSSPSFHPLIHTNSQIIVYSFSANKPFFAMVSIPGGHKEMSSIFADQ